jgi:acyl-CoA thioesterase FadM
MEYLLVSPEGEPLASGETIMVMFDYSAGRSKAVPEDVARAIRHFEKEALD